MQFLAIEQEAAGVTAEQFQPHLKAEAACAWELYKAGIIRTMYFNPDDHTAVLMLECDSREDAQAALESLPLVQAGLISFTLMPLVPYTGFERLFCEQG